MPNHADRGSLSSHELGTMLADVLRGKAEGTRIYPVSFAQQRLWFVEQLEPGRATHHMTAGLLLRGLLDVDALDRSVGEVTRRHAALRTGFEDIDGTPVQVVHGQLAVSLHRRRVGRNEHDAGGVLERLLADEASQPFDLEMPPLFRAVLWSLGPDEHVLQFTVHHLVADRRSIELWFEDVSACYEAYRRGQAATLAPLPVQYGEFAAWQREQWAERGFDAQVAYWREKLSPAPAPLRLAGATTRLPSANRTAGSVIFRVARAVSDALENLGRGEDATPFMTLLTAFQVLLSHASGERDVAIGTPIASRPNTEVERVLGLFVNMLVLRVDVAADLTFRQLLRRTRETAVQAYKHQDLPFEQVVEAVQPRRRTGQTPLFHVYFAFQSSWAAGVRFAGLETSAVAIPATTTAFDLNLTVTQDADGLTCAVVYDAGMFEAAAAEELAARFAVLLTSIADAPDVHVSALGTGLRREDAADRNRRLGGVDAYDLTPMQGGMLFHCLHAPRSGAYHVQAIVSVTGGDLDVEHFCRAWQELAARHAVLRTSFDWVDRERPGQVVHANVEVPVRVLDWSGRPPGDHEAAWSTLLKDDELDGFDLSTAPLMRVVLVRVAPGRYEFLWSVHHLILDQWSAALLLDDVRTIYSALVEGRVPSRPPRRPYRDFIDWLAAQDRERAKAFWTHAYTGWSGPTPVGMGRLARPGRQPGPSRTSRGRLGPDSAAALKKFVRERRVTTGTLLTAAWALVLSRYSGQHDIVFGLVVSGRSASLTGVENMVGMFVNTIPVRLRVEEDATVASWLTGVQDAIAAFREREHSSLVDIQGWIDKRGTPLFDTLFVISPRITTAGDGAQRQAFVPRRFEERTNLPLTMAVTVGDEVDLAISYDADRFDDAEMARVLEHVRIVVTGMLSQPSGRVADLPLLSPRERQQLAAWNDTVRPRPPHRAVHHMFEEQAARTPHALAVDDLHTSVTYAELDARASAIAATLRGQSVGPNVLVGISIDRSIEMIVLMLGVLKAGGAYVPLDAMAPEARLRAILDETSIRLVLTNARRQEVFARIGVETLVFGGQPNEPLGPSVPSGIAADEGDHLAYVIYTSGSTGRPKGVMVTHRNLVHSTGARLAVYPEPVGRFLLLSPFVFDSAVAGLFWTLCSGGCLVLAEEQRQLDLPWLAGVIKHARITHLLAIPGFYAELLEAGRSELEGLTAVIVAGEACTGDLVAHHHAVLPGVPLYNEYGPTEATVWATVHRCEPADGRAPVPIGRPIPNVSAWIMDGRQRLVPPGVSGEVYIGGDGVAAGYLGRPDLTSERFPLDPFRADGVARLYRTGDKARYREDGAIEFLGRLDDQVKVRGFRIEVGEIEAVLMQHPSVQRAVVLARGGGHQEATGLVAFVSAHPGLSIPLDELRAFAQNYLPEYMVPAELIVVDEWPTTQTGKVDRAALRARPRRPAEVNGRTRPISPREAQMADIWATVLQLSAVGVEENFFELGGHSLLAMQVVSRIRRVFGVDLPIAVLFERPTIAAICREMTASDATTRPPRGPMAVSASEIDRSLYRLLTDGH